MGSGQQVNKSWIPPKFVCIRDANLREVAIAEFPSLKNLVKSHMDRETVIVVDDKLKRSCVNSNLESEYVGVMFANYRDFAVVYSKIYCYIFVGSSSHSDLKLNVSKFMRSILEHNKQG